MLSGNSISQIVPFAVGWIIGKYYAPEELAVFTNVMAIASMLGIIATGRLEIAIPISKEKTDAQKIVYTGLLFTLGVGAVSLLFPLFSDFVGTMYKDDRIKDYLYVVPIGVVLIGLSGIVTNWLLRHKKFMIISISRVGMSIANHGLVALLGFIGWGIEGFVLGWIAALVANIAILMIGVNTKIRFRDYSLKDARQVLRDYRDFPLVNSLHAFTDIFANQFLLFWLISSFVGLGELGLFAMMNRYVRAPIKLVSSSVSQVFYTEAADARNKQLPMMPIFRRTVFISLGFSVPFVIVVLLAGPILFEWYFSSEWRESGVYAQCISFSLLCNFLVSPVSGVPIIFEKQRKAYVFAVVGYTVSLLSILFTTLAGWSFYHTLIVFSVTMGIYYLSLLRWYYQLIRSHDESVD